MTGKLFFLLKLFVLTNAAFPQNFIPSKIDSMIQVGIHLTIKQSYTEAMTIFKKIEEEIPRSPIGYFFQAAVLQTQMLDYEKYDKEKEFYNLIDRALKFAKQQIREERQTASAFLFMGLSYNYLSFFQIKQNKYWQAITNVKKSGVALENALRLDSKLYDAHFGLGVYQYYLGKIGRYLDWLPFIENRRENSLKMIEIAMKKGRYSNYSAMNALCWLSIEEEAFERSLEITEQALAKFPKSRAFLWCAGKAATQLDRHQKAANYYNKILNSLMEENVLSPYNEFTCRKNLVGLYLKMNAFPDAVAECQKITKIKLDKETQTRLKDSLKDINKTCSDFKEYSLLNN